MSLVKNRIIVSILFAFIIIPVNGQNKHGKSTLYKSYKGLVMAGYQGWFRAEGDGTGHKWNMAIDIWPDVSEYEKTYESGLRYADGRQAMVFSSVDKSTTDLHFKWMKEYGLDGVFMQRFFDVTRGYKDSNKSEDKILRNALQASKINQRAIGVMYDLSGLEAEGEDCSSVIEDWKMLVDELKVTNQGDDQTYIFHNGKPLVTIWGVGFPDRPYNIRKIGLKRLIDFLKNDPVYGGCSVMLGVPTYFRDLDKDCIHDSYLHELIESVDIVLPWMVQRFTPYLQQPIDHQRDHVIADIHWCKEHGVDYVPIVYPGFSWRNLAKNNPKLARYTAYGAIPRLEGHFYWDQFATMINAGAEMIYVAMFDEINEGTAIFKVSDTPPNTEKDHFIDNDGMPSDHFLWLTGMGAKMLRKEIPLSFDMPVRN